MLSHDEQRRLDEIERGLAQDDPDLTRALGALGEEGRRGRGRLLASLAAYAVGLLFILVGSSVVAVALIGAGIAILFAAATAQVGSMRGTRPGR